ncbi:MAG: efflux RND transporter permease subunit [Gammaproteobacteria bacterium]|nr:efflux RND transporter permease subunit [Gammaproteobacteria bacterium]
MMRRYIGWVEKALHYRRWAILIAAATFILALALIPFISKTFLPSTDVARIQLQLELPPGVRLVDSLNAAREVRERLRASVPELQSVFTTVGAEGGTGMGGSVSFSEVRRINLTLEFIKKRKRNSQQLEAAIRGLLTDMPGIRLTFATMGPGGRLVMNLTGDEAQLVEKTAREIAAAIRTVPGLGVVTTSAALLRPEIIIRPNPARAADLGVSTIDIADAARIATTGDFIQRLAKLNLADRQVPIRVQLAGTSLTDISVLGQLRVPGARGSVPLSSVADITEGSGPARIDRVDRERNVTVTADLNGQPLGDVMNKVRQLPVLKILPGGVRILPAGDAEAFVELFVGFALALLTGLVCIYLVLMVLFKSGSQPLTILAAVPLCGGGAFGMLLLTGYALSLPSLIGLLLLTGIATKNSILIVDYAILGEKAGLSRHDALIEACRKRVRPVLMTTIAMGAGMLPIALSLGPDGGFRAPLGISVIGGLVTSTLLSLVVVPAVYSVVAQISEHRIFHRAT